MDKTYVFDNSDGGCGGNGMMGLITSLCQNRGLDPNLVASLMSNRGNGFGDGNGSWIWVIFLFFLMGWGRNGWGGFGGNGQGDGNFLAGQLANDNGRELLMSAIQGNGQAISHLASTLNCDINAVQGALNAMQNQLCNISSQIGLSSQQIINAVQAGNCDIASKLCSCCCDIKTLVTNQGYENRITTINQTNDIVQNATSNTNVLAAKIDAQTQIINDKFCALEMREMQNKIDALRQENNQLALAASQQAQTANIVNQIRPMPQPSYFVPNPFGCGCNYGLPYGNNGCGNGCNNGCGC